MSDNAPPAKRMRLHTEKMFDSSDDKENICPHAKPEVRKRKTPKRKAEPKLSDLDSYVLLEVFDYLSVEDLCNLAEMAHGYLLPIAEQSFQYKCKNGLLFLGNGMHDCVLLKRVLKNFGHLITSVNISTRRRH